MLDSEAAAESSPATVAAPAIFSAGSTVVQTATAEAPLMTAASPRGSLSTPGGVLLTLLGGGSQPGTPESTPLVWAALALTRRELSANAAAVAPAATTASAEPADSGVADLVGQFTEVFTGQVRGFIVGSGGSTALADVVAPLVADAAAGWILNGTVGPQLTQLASNATVGAFIASQMALQLTNSGVPQQVSAAVGTAVADAIRVAFGNPANTALTGAVDAFIGAVPWVSASLTDTLSALVSAEVTVVDIVGGQLGSAAFQNAANALLENPAVPQAIGTAATTLIRDLAADPAIRALISTQLGAMIGATADGSPTATAIGTAITNVVGGLLADSALLDGVATAAGTSITTFLSQPGIPAALTGIVGQISTALLTGANIDTVLQTALAGLQSNPQIPAAISATLGAAAAALLGDPTFPQALGTATSTAIRALAADPAIRAVLAEQLAALLATTANLGPAATALGDLGALLADQAVLDALATIAGDTVTTFLSQPGLAAGLSVAAEQITTALLAGADPATALAALQTNAQLQAAISATLPGFVNAVLGIDQLRQAVSAATGALITAALNDPALVDAGIGSLSGVAGTVADAVVDSLLGNTAVGDLISSVAVDVLSGTPSSEMLDIVVDSVLTDGAIQVAVGVAIGQGIGALFGENLIGAFVGWVAGGFAALTIGVAAGIANLVLLLNPGFTLFPAAAAATSRADSSYVLIV